MLIIQLVAASRPSDNNNSIAIFTSTIRPVLINQWHTGKCKIARKIATLQ